MYIDLMCFPKRQFAVPIFDVNFPKPSIIQYTAAPPVMTKAMDIIAEVKKTVEQFLSQDGVSIVHTVDDLENLSDDIEVVLGLQMPPVDATWDDLHTLKKLGVHLTTLAYKDDESPYGGGFLSERRLTTKGAELLSFMNEVGMWLDLSHAGHETARDAIELIDNNMPGLPVLATHTGCYEVYDYSRNLPDDILTDIARLRGIVGLYTLSFGLSPDDDSLVPFTKHLEHLLGVCGWESAAIGTDGVYEELTEKFRRDQVAMMKEKIDTDGRMRSRYPVEAHVLNTVRKDSILLGTMLEQRLSADLINDIRSQNALRFLKRNL